MDVWEELGNMTPETIGAFIDALRELPEDELQDVVSRMASAAGVLFALDPSGFTQGTIAADIAASEVE